MRYYENEYPEPNELVMVRHWFIRSGISKKFLRKWLLRILVGIRYERGYDSIELVFKDNDKGYS